MVGEGGKPTLIQAFLNGKLSREQENMEDVLTSCVFGMLRLAPPSLGVLPYLAQAKTIDGEYPLKNLQEGFGGDEAEVDYRFWPRWEHCEPDVVLSIPQRGVLIAVEAKYRSAKSSEADEDAEDVTDQLAREWQDLIQQRETPNLHPILVYLTADVAIPEAEIQKSLYELRKKSVNDEVAPVICWLSWRHLWGTCNDESNRALTDIRQLVDRLGLTFFKGITPVPSIRSDWKFQDARSSWTYDVRTISCDWRFQA